MLFLLADGMSHSKLANLTPNSCRSHYFGCFKVERSVVVFPTDVLNKILFGNQKRKNSNGRGTSSTPRRKSNKNRTTFSSTPCRKNSKGKGTHRTPGSGRHGSSHSILQL